LCVRKFQQHYKYFRAVRVKLPENLMKYLIGILNKNTALDVTFSPEDRRSVIFVMCDPQNILMAMLHAALQT